MPITEGGRFTPDNVIVSPGVFTRENDLSGVTQGVADIGAVVVAPFAKGPSFSPTLVTNTADLQTKFGIPDGVYYGPYTANEYLKQKGFVTVCRVGALTGYNQNHPLVIYADQGEWTRNNDTGSLVSQSAFIQPSGSYSNNWSAGLSFTSSTSGSYSGGLTGSGILNFKNPVFSFTLTGSQIMNNTPVVYNWTSSTLISISCSYTASYSTLTSILSTGTLTGNFANVNLLLPYQGESYEIYGEGLDANANLISGSLILDNSGGCSTPVFRITGTLSGAFGAYNGGWTSSVSAPGLDSCGNLTTGSGIRRIVAVLNDTMAGGIDVTLTAPGFTGSTLTTYALNNNSSSINPSYTLNLSSSNGFGWGAYNFSLNQGANDYITNVFGNNPAAGNPATQTPGQKVEAAYIYSIYQDVIADINANPSDWKVGIASPIDFNAPGFSQSIQPLKFTDQYSLSPTTGDSNFSINWATTPWITSQAVAGVNGTNYRFELFQVVTLTEGTNANTSYKIEISNVKLAGTVPGSNYGTFTLSVRDFSDTENRPKYLETYQNLTLDPTSPDFIARRIGDRYNYIAANGKIIEFGTFSNVSNYIRIVMTTNNYPISAVPYGFEPYYAPYGGTVIDYITSTVKYSKASTSTNNPGKFASGVVFGQTLTADSEIIGLYPTSSAGTFIYNDNLQYFVPLPSNISIGRNTGFYLDVDYTTNGVGTSAFISSSTTGQYVNAVPSVVTSYESTYVKMRKFVLGFQGGFDGQSPATQINVGSNIVAGNTQGLNCATVSSPGSVAYAQALGALSNADVFDINLLVMPGIFHSLHSYVSQLGIDLCEQRGDCFYIMDNIVFPNTNQPVSMINAAVNDVSTVDSNYVATYYPWVKILDTNLNQIVSVPPSVLMPSIYASNDAAAAEWFAPAGLNRGGIPQAVQVLDRLTNQERDTLYQARVNPIATFPGQGICVWGQKTLQIKHSALDRINVRRLLINLKKFIASTSKYLVFEQNTSDTRNRFLGVVNPYLESVQQRSGLYAYKVVCDATNNTADIIDNNILYGQIYLQPSKTAEYIVLDFNILPTGANFPGA
jgi:Phage tail sheath protein subtilisin-like domain/Phage tail sheath C-terminal domain